MNVSEGDLARIVGQPNNAMALVRVLWPVPDDRGTRTLVRPAGVCECLSPVSDDRTGKVALAGKQALIADRALRPLYDGDGSDESLSWADVPSPAAKVQQ